jgi:exosome complex exonuclease DIS3/RRP44
MWSSNRSFYRVTRKGKLLKTVREHYLRDDLDSSLPFDWIIPVRAEDTISDVEVFQKLSATPAFGHYVVLDTNIPLGQMDVLEHPSSAFTDVIIPQTVMEEVKHRNLSLYNRLQVLIKDEKRRCVVFSNEHHRETYVPKVSGESPNDYCDRAIREVCKWYAKQTRGEVDIVLVTNDRENRNKLQQETVQGDAGPVGNVTTTSIHDYVLKYAKDIPELTDMLSHSNTSHADFDDGDEDDVDDDGEEGGGGASKPGSKPLPLKTSSNKSKAKAAANKLAGSSGGTGKFPPRARNKAHLSMKEVRDRMKAGTVFEGVLRATRRRWDECTVVVKLKNTSGDGTGVTRFSVSVSGEANVNRAIDGDVVVVEILPESEWKADQYANRKEKEAAAAAERQKKKEAGGDSDDDDDDVPDDSAGVPEPTNGEVGELNPSGKKKAMARVVCVLKRNWRPVCGSLEMTDVEIEQQQNSKDKDRSTVGLHGSWSLFVPVDRRLPKVRIQTRQREVLLDKRIIVVIDSWPPESRYPLGHYVKTLGTIGDQKTETQVVLFEHDIPTREFSAEVMACLPPKNWKITPENSKGRRDLRGLPICRSEKHSHNDPVPFVCPPLSTLPPLLSFPPTLTFFLLYTTLLSFLPCYF